MERNSTRLYIAFVSVLLAVFVIIEYGWINVCRERKLSHFNHQVIDAITTASISMTESTQECSDKSISSILSQSLVTVGLSQIKFTFSTRPNQNSLSSPAFVQKTGADPDKLTFQYPLKSSANTATSAILTVTIPDWKEYATKGMNWIYTICLSLTFMVMAVFGYTLILIRQKARSEDIDRTEIALLLMQQLEIPLSTIAVAVEVLDDDGLTLQTEKRRDLHLVINEENKRMNDRVREVLRS